MTRRPSIAVVGSYGVGWTFRVDAIPSPGETVTSHGLNREHGGKGSNQAVAAARLGADVHLLTAVGRDSAGDDAVALWQAEGVAADARRSDLPTMVGVVAVDDNGENSIIIEPGALSDLTPADVDAWRSVLTNSDLCVVQLEIPLDVAVYALEVASSAGVSTLLNPAPWCSLPEDVHRHVDYLVLNETEAAALLDRSHDRSSHTLAHAAKVATVVTKGGRGATIHHHDNWSRSLPAHSVDPVDTTGAGDSFVAAFAVALASHVEVTEAVALACRAAGHSVTGHGVIPTLPYRHDVWTVSASNQGG